MVFCPYLWWGAEFAGPEGAGLLPRAGVVDHGEAALVVAVLLPPAVTLLPLLHNPIAAYGSLGTRIGMG